MDGMRTHHLNMYWYYVPQFSGGWLHWECTVHNRHSAKAWTRKKAQQRAEAMCSQECPLWTA